MKSAYELAMERLGGSRAYTEAQKEELAQIDRVCEAKKAEATLRADARLREAGDDAEKEEAVRADLTDDLARLERRKEADKDKVRERSE